MRVEVDQSGKTGDTRVPTVLAFSNGWDYAILIPATVKRKCLETLRKHGRSGRFMYSKLFAAGLYLLLKDHISRLSEIVIDMEYPGWGADIKLYLLNMLRRKGIKFDSTRIRFASIGKKSGAHSRAIAVYKKAENANKAITVDEILSEY
ncbi:MAG: hypothetical protein L6Q26_07300 [Anaerolineales bacterium]|nr:hypothetical protein [Anaerolineales bacterium]NUQ83581.1 hypothetical protein [Anaerolineales bacterium]